MPLPAGVDAVTLNAGTNGLRGPDGTARTGTVTLTPSVDRVVSSEHGMIVLGPSNATLGASGQFTLGPVLATDADGFSPSGWTYRVDEDCTGQPPRSYNISLPASSPTVSLSDLVEVSASDGTVVLTPGGTPSSTVVAETTYGQASTAGVATAYSRGDHTHGTPALPPTGTTAGTYAAGNDSRLSDARTPTAHAASHGSGGSDPVTLAQSQVTGLTAALAGKAAGPASSTDNAVARYDGTTGALLQDSGVTIADDGAVAVGGALTVSGYTTLAGGQFNGSFAAFGDMTLYGTNKGFRFRRGGSATDFEGAGTDLVVSVWSGGDFTGTQHSYLRLSSDAQNVQIAGKVEHVDALYGTVRHVLDGAANTVGLYGATPVVRQTVSGSRADGTALTDLIARLAATGIIADGTSAGITNAWRRRDLPDPVIADSLYTGTAPSISTAQTTTPQSGFIKYAPAGVALSGTDVTGPFTYAGAANFAIGAVSPDTNYVLPLSKYPNTYASGQSVWSVEFGTDAQTIQVRMKYISTATMYRLSVDGRKVTDLMQASGGTTAGSGHLITIDFGSAAPRRIRLDFSTFPFGGIYIPPTATLWGVPLQGGRLMVLGDSIPDGSSQNTGAGCGTWVDRLGRLFGCTDVWRQGRGGTGYITAGSYATFGDRASVDVIPHAPDRLIIWGGYNDSSGSQSAIASAAASLYSAVNAGLPGCQPYVIGCWSPTGSPGAGITNTDATLRTAAAAAGIPFISPVSGAVYNASGALVATHGAWITAANAASYIGADAVHPNDAGHIYLARRISAAIRTLMPA